MPRGEYTPGSGRIQTGMPDPNLDPTAGYKPLPKSPNFGLVVAMACVAFLLLLAGAVLLLRSKATKMAPHAPNPTPNSQVQPLLPAPNGLRPNGSVA